MKSSSALTNWLLGAMFVALISVVGMLYWSVEARLDRIEVTVEQIRARYGLIAVLDDRVMRQATQLDRIEALLLARP
jgi:tetrahydromethanopterin S-methyltransferase subunit F